MEKIIYSTYEELSIETAEKIAAYIIDKPDALLCFPAGNTSLGTFNELINIYKEGRISFRNCKLVGLDEWLGLGELKKENCYSFLKKNLLNHIDISEENICFFDGETSDPDMECSIAENFLKKHGPIDMLLLGAGMNGHIGLNEPGIPFARGPQIVDLDETTRRVGQKYFTCPVNLTKGISLGIENIMDARTLILQLSGNGKAEIARNLIFGEVTTEFPVSIIKSHKNSYLLLDKKASENL